MTEDLDLFLNDFGEDVVIGAAAPFKGIFDCPDELIGSGMILSTEYVLLAKTSDLLSLAAMAPLTVGGVAYKSRREPQKIDDGKFSRVILSKP